MTLRKWQTEALAKWSTTRRGVASVVTGAGKTRFALACIQAMQASEPDLRVLVIVPTHALVDQWLVVLQSEDRATRGGIAVHRGGVLGRVDASINVATVNTARTATEALTQSGRWMLVADECHRYASPSNRVSIDADWTASLGLSATPSREYDEWFEEYVVPSIGPIFFEYGYAEAHADGILAPFDLTNYRVPLTAREEQEYTRLSRRVASLSSDTGTHDEARRTALLARSRLAQNARARTPAAIELMKSHRGERALVFHENVAAAETIVDLLRNDGHRVVAYHSQMSPASSLKSLLMFRTGQADVLVSCRALDEGLDVPDATFGLVCASSASTRQRVQRLGRLLRPSPGKTHAEVATIYATERERVRLEEEEEDLVGVTTVRWFEVRFS